MAHRQELKISEARLIMFLSQVNNQAKFPEHISRKLLIDYGYCIRILKDMVYKGWVFRHKYGRKVFYDVTSTAPLDKCKDLLVNGTKKEMEDIITQTKLEVNPDGIGKIEIN